MEPKHRRYFLFALGLMIGLVLVMVSIFNTSANRWLYKSWNQVLGQPQMMHESEARYIRQMVGKEAEVGRTIVWQSDMPEEDAFVEYRLVKDASVGNQVITVPASNHEFTDDGRTSYIHEALLDQLSPDSSYQYRVGYGDKVSDWHDLKTGDSHSEYTALIFPDSQSVDYSTWGHIVRDAYGRNPDAAFFTVMGDLVDNGQDSSQWPILPILNIHKMG